MSLVASMSKDTLFIEAADLYFDMLAESGKPPRLPQLVKALAVKHSIDAEMIRNLLRDPEFDAMLISRRKRRIIEEAALKVTAAEYAERIATGGLAKLVDLIETGADMTPKDLIAAVKLASDLNAQVDKDISQVTGTGDVTVNIQFKELLLKVDPERRGALMQEAMRRIGAPMAEVIDASCSEE